MIVICDVSDCRNKDENGDCTFDEIRIVDTFHADAPAACEGYEPITPRSETFIEQCSGNTCVSITNRGTLTLNL